MVQKLKVLLASIVLLIVSVLPVAVPVYAGTTNIDVQTGLCQGVNVDLGTTTCTDPNAGAGVTNLIRQIINIISIIVGVVAVIMIIIGGLRYITSSGDSSNVSSAKNTILYAIVGLIVVALAQLIVRFVVAKLDEVQ